MSSSETKQKYSLKPQVNLIYGIFAIVCVFLAGGFVGWVYETFLCAWLNGENIDLSHGGLGIPFLQIYAIGAVVMELVFGLGREKTLPWWLQLIGCGVLCTVLEYGAGLSMLYGPAGVQTWDYRIPGWDFLCTPDGLICLRASLTFALFGLLLLRVVDPIFCLIWNGKDTENTESPGAINKRRTIIGIIMIILLVGVILAMLNSYVFNIIDVGGTWH